MRTSTVLNPKQWWRPFISYLFIVLASVCLIAGIATRYVQNNILNTDKFVEITGSLPKQPEVAQALAQYTTTKLFDSGLVAQALNNFFPDRLSPLVGPLNNILKNKLYDVTYSFVQSDRFTAAWMDVNRAAQSQFLAIAESSPRVKEASKYQLQIKSLLNAAQERFGGNEILADERIQQLETITLDAKLKLNQIRDTVKFVRFGSLVLPYVMLAFLLAAVAVAYNRRRAVLVAGIFFIITSTLMFIGAKIGVQAIVSDIADTVYQNAARAIYEAFYAGLRRQLQFAMFAGIVLVIIATLAGPYKWAQSFRHFVRIDSLQKNQWYKYLGVFRVFANKWLMVLRLVPVAVLAIVLLSVSVISWEIVTITISILVCYLSIVQMIARPAPIKLKDL